MVYIKEEMNLMFRKLTNLELNLEIGSEKYFPTLLGHPINKIMTKPRKIVYNM